MGKGVPYVGPLARGEQALIAKSPGTLPLKCQGPLRYLILWKILPQRMSVMNGRMRSESPWFQE